MGERRLILFLIGFVILFSIATEARTIISVDDIPLNNPPIIQFYSPQNLFILIKEGDSILFNVQAFDPENDLLTYRWYYDNKLVYKQNPDYYHNYQSSWNYVSNYYSNGSHFVRVEVSDGIGITAQQWNMNIKDRDAPARPPINQKCVIDSETGEIIKCAVTIESLVEEIGDVNYDCNAQEANTKFGRDRSPNSTGITRNYTHTKNITTVSQFQNWTHVPNGNYSCVPAVVTSGLEYWNRTLPSIMRNLSIFEVANRLHRLMETNASTGGTTTNGLLNGLTFWLNRTAYAGNMSITIIGAGIDRNNSVIGRGVNVSFVTGTGDGFFPVSISMILNEFISKNEFVILSIETTAGNHAVAIHSISNTPNSNGNYDIAVMDPASGEIKETEIRSDGVICTRYDEQGTCEEWTTVTRIISISIND